jgi:HlyD family secretion protein
MIKEENFMNKKKKLIGAIIILLSAIAVSGFILKVGKESEDSNQVSDFSVVEAISGSVSIKVEGPAVIEPYQIRNIRSAIEGSVLYIAREGDLVEEGEILVSFDGSDKERIVQQAILNLSKAELNKERNVKILEKTQKALDDSMLLFETGAISQEQVISAETAAETALFNLEASKLDVKQSLLSLELAKKDLENIHLRASFTGVVLSIEVYTGDLVNKGNSLMIFADLSKVLLKAEIDEYDIVKIQPGQKVTITSESLGDEKAGSKVERISPAAEVINNISIFTVSTVLNNDEGILKPGMSADLSILISSDKGLVVPSKAVSSVRGRSYLIVYENEEIVTKKVTVGSDDGVNIVVLEGLDEGEFVIIPLAPGFQLSTSNNPSSGSSVIPVSIPGSGAR